MEAPAKLVSLIGGSLGVVVALYTGITFTHDKLQQVDELEKKIERQNEDIKQIPGNVIIDQIKTELRVLQSRIFKIEDRYGEDVFDAPGLVREEYKQNKSDIETLQEELKATKRAYKALR